MQCVMCAALCCAVLCCAVLCLAIYQRHAKQQLQALLDANRRNARQTKKMQLAFCVLPACFAVIHS